MRDFAYRIVCKYLWATTRLLWSITALMLPLSIALSLLKHYGVILIEWEQILSCVMFLVIFDPILIITDLIRFGFENEIGGGEDVERRTKENG